jgi:hypothetical protein
MTTIKNTIFLILVLFATSCTKVIDLNLKAGEPVYVIEGNFSDDSVGNLVKISRSVALSEPNNFPTVSNAIVTITDENGNVEILNHSQNGEYEILTTQAVFGKTYKLNVQVDGKTFTAQSTMPYPTKIDSLDFLAFSFGPTENINIVPIYVDSAGIDNYYRFVVAVNDEVSDDIFVNDDDLIDGIQARQPYFGQYELKKGDTASVTLQCIDKNVYLYYFSLQQNTSGDATPANPVTNVTGGAIGYFSAHASSKKSRIVPQ